jgi:O-antigen ligase
VELYAGLADATSVLGETVSFPWLLKLVRYLHRVLGYKGMPRSVRYSAPRPATHLRTWDSLWLYPSHLATAALFIILLGQTGIRYAPGRTHGCEIYL